MVLLIGSIALAIGFVLVQRVAAEPIIPLRLFRGGVYRVGVVFSFLAGIAMFGGIIFLPARPPGREGLPGYHLGPGDAPAVAGIGVVDHGGSHPRQDRPLQDSRSSGRSR